MAVENPYIAKARLQTLRRYMPVSKNWNFTDDKDDHSSIPDNYLTHSNIEYRPINQLDDDREVSIRMMSDIQKICDSLPCIDCGFCGAPTCHAFAEDIVKGEAKESDCVVRMREILSQLKSNDSKEEGEA